MPEEIKPVIASRVLTAAARKKAVAEIIERAAILNYDDLQQILEALNRFGVPATEFVAQTDYLRDFVTKNKLSAVGFVKQKFPGPTGGMLAEFKHFHLDKMTYVLNEAQCAQIQKDFAKEIQVSLKNAAQIKF